jgi:ABC-type sugar transport system substrate-binding protein
MTNGKTLIALFTAIALGLLGAASVAQASNENDGGNETGGFVVPGSMVGVNPVYHPEWFGKMHKADRAVDAFGSAPMPSHRHKAR